MMRLLTKRGGWAVVFVCSGCISTGKVRIQVFDKVGANLGGGVCWTATRATPLPSAKAGEGRGGSRLKRPFWEHTKSTSMLLNQKQWRVGPVKENFAPQSFLTQIPLNLECFIYYKSGPLWYLVLKWEIFVKLDLNVHCLIENVHVGAHLAQSECQIFEIHSSRICPLDSHMPGSNTNYIESWCWVKKNVPACPRARGAGWLGLLSSLMSLLRSFEIAAKANGLGWRHGTMVLPSQLGGIHFTDAWASSCAIKNEMVFDGEDF